VLDTAMKRIRVLHIGLDEKRGGIESLLFGLYETMNKDILDFEFLSYQKNYALEKEFSSLGAKVYQIPSFSNTIAYLKFWRWIIRHGEYDIFHFHKNSAANLIPMIIAKLYGAKKVIIHSHNTNPSISNPVTKLLHQINKPLLNLLATRRIACSKVAANWLFGKPIVDKNKVDIVYNGIDTEKFKFNSETRKEIRNEFNFTDDDFVIGHVGRFSLQKNHSFMIDLFAECMKREPNFRLLLVGEGDLYQIVKDKVDRLGLTEKVLFAGQRNDLDKIYQAMDMFMLPSIYEGYPIVAIEAQVSGLPCLISDSVTGEVVNSKMTGLVPLNNGVSVWVSTIMQYSKSILLSERQQSQTNICNIKDCMSQLQIIYEQVTE
jgi:glycosyltransferase involved in cell wall biosynthesis